MINRVVLVTGGFDPLHSGHIEYFKAAKALGNILAVGVNSDAWLERKKGRAFMPSTERINIIQNLKMVDHCILFNDNDDTAIEAIKNVKMMYPNSQIVFANGGDRTKDNIPEMIVKDVEFAFGIGGEDKKAPKTDRPWGYYRVLHEVPGTKVKELTINSKQTLTMQKHYERAEYWHIAEGACIVELDNGYKKLNKHDNYHILNEQWHRLHNPYDNPCKIVEIQYGNYCGEDDIDRR